MTNDASEFVQMKPTVPRRYTRASTERNAKPLQLSQLPVLDPSISIFSDVNHGIAGSLG